MLMVQQHGDKQGAQWGRAPQVNERYARGCFGTHDTVVNMRGHVDRSLKRSIGNGDKTTSDSVIEESSGGTKEEG